MLTLTDPFHYPMGWLGLGAVGVMILSLLSARRQYEKGVDHMIAATILSVSWACVYFGQVWFPAPPPPPELPPPFLAFVSVLDGFSALFIAWMAYTKPAAWKTTLLVLLGLELAVETAFWGWAWVHGETPHGLLTYRAWLCNCLYILQLVCVGWAGAAHAFSGRTGDIWGVPLPHRHRRHPPVGSA